MMSTPSFAPGLPSSSSLSHQPPSSSSHDSPPLGKVITSLYRLPARKLLWSPPGFSKWQSFASGSRAPQSAQSVPIEHSVNVEPEPPSSQAPLLEDSHVSRHMVSQLVPTMLTWMSVSHVLRSHPIHPSWERRRCSWSRVPSGEPAFRASLRTSSVLANLTSPDWVWPFATNEASRAVLDVFRFSALLRAHRSKNTSVRLE